MKKEARVQILQELIEGKPKSSVEGVANTPIEQVDNEIIKQADKPVLKVIHAQKLLYRGSFCNYYVLGNLPQDFSTLSVTLSITEDVSDKRIRQKLDLYERAECQTIAKSIANFFFTSEETILAELIELTNLLEAYRDKQVDTQQAQYEIVKAQSPMLPASEKAAIEVLNQQNLLEDIDRLLLQAGIQEEIRLLLYVIGASYKCDTPLHIGVTGNETTVKRLVNDIGQCLPSEDILTLTNLSARSLYHCVHGELMNKIMLLPNGVDNKAAQPLTQLMEGEVIATATTVKDRLGNMRSMIEQVHSHFSTIMSLKPDEDHGCTIRANLEPNSDRIIKYNNRKLAGLIDVEKELQAKQLLQNLVRCIKKVEVIIPDIDKIALPVHEDAKLRFNTLYLHLVKQVCLLHQYQRKKDSNNRLVATIEDMEIAADMLVSFMVTGEDELEPALRSFYEQVKLYAKEVGINHRFTMREIRQQFKLSKNFCFRYMAELQKLEYVKRVGYANRGFQYEVLYFDDASREKERIYAELKMQFEQIAGVKSDLKHRTPDGQKETAGTHESLVGKRVYADGITNSKAFAHTLNEPVHRYKESSKNIKANEKPTDK